MAVPYFLDKQNPQALDSKALVPTIFLYTSMCLGDEAGGGGGWLGGWGRQASRCFPYLFLGVDLLSPTTITKKSQKMP